jgi:hypothetical protein
MFHDLLIEGVVEHSSNMPDPVALSSAEAEYNESCLACMTAAHLKQFLEDLEWPFVDDKKSKKPIQIFIDNRSAVDMDATFKDTQRTRHMMRRYHYVREGVENIQHQDLGQNSSWLFPGTYICQSP